jgi:hypothetical protein
MRRTPAEYVLIASFFGSIAFMGYLTIFGAWHRTGPEHLWATLGARILWLGLVTSFVALGVAAFALLLKRSTFGAALTTLFYGMQLVSVTRPSGWKFEFVTLPTVYFRVHGTSEAPVSINVLALVLVLLSAALWWQNLEAKRSSAARSTGPSE